MGTTNRAEELAKESKELFNNYSLGYDSTDFGSSIQYLMNEQDLLKALVHFDNSRQSEIDELTKELEALEQINTKLILEKLELTKEVERLRKENESYKELENESKNDWISVDNFLPLDRESVIIFWIHEGKKRITSGSYNHEGKYWSHGNATQMKVTHWRKLPQPPINH